ncbi:hypothetical protein DFP93_101315 [Aneurinibacillus soli]|uniref:Uncharacterized protein n=1 Tax=Aneurinibacillus soli TaxID=1500254 RepID=A0A0U5BJ68_9BACL|nr:hypothetical protein [Aneurinibacillus soli]PYE64289.1 hypothetical protein DFP93_101315 [Aneurinibacillus soli]BAU28238.1 hypothetical protein CB4_02412 [Aneurinibacillus soli]
MRKFEYVFAFAVLAVLTAALFIAMLVLRDKDMTMTILTVLIGALSAVTAFFFTKHVPKQKDNEKDM